MLGKECMGGTPSHRLGRQTEQQKRNKYKIHRGLKWPPVDDLYATTNQKQAAATERSMEGRSDQREVRGKRNSIVLGALDVE